MMKRREFLQKAVLGGIALAATRRVHWPGAATAETSESKGMPTRVLGKTGVQACLFSLGGEGVLRTTGRLAEAQAVIRRALELGVNYFDTAPAYQQSQDYLGATLGSSRDNIFLASKTHERSKEGSLRLLENSLKRLKTDRLDLWQLHDLRGEDDIEQIFGPGGAIEAVEQAKRQGKIRFAGITGHTYTHILLDAMRRYDFDSVLLPVNVADRARLSFIEEVIPEAQARGMSVVGMKVMEHGQLFDGLVTPREAMHYALSQAVSTIIVGCSSPREVEENVAAARDFRPLEAPVRQELEQRLLPRAHRYNLFKG